MYVFPKVLIVSGDAEERKKKVLNKPFSFLEIFERSLVKALFDFVPDPE